MTNRRLSETAAGTVHSFLRLRMLAVMAGVLCLTVAIAACGGGGDDSSSTGAAGVQTQGDAPTLNIAVASYDLAAGKDVRFIAGVLTTDNNFVSFGTAEAACDSSASTPRR